MSGVSFVEYIKDLANLSLRRFNSLHVEDQEQLIKWYIEDVLQNCSDYDLDFWGYIDYNYHMDPEEYKTLELEQQLDMYFDYAEYKGLDDYEPDAEDYILDMIEEVDYNEIMAED